MKFARIADFIASDLFASLGGGFIVGAVLVVSGLVGGDDSTGGAVVAAVMSVAG